MRAVSLGIEIHAKEQLPQRHEDLFTEEPQRLENLSHICSTSEGTQLDHRHHAPAERLRWLQKVPNELKTAKSSHMENIGWFCMVVEEHKIL
jgi:hypothetical protein